MVQLKAQENTPLQVDIAEPGTASSGGAHHANTANLSANGSARMTPNLNEATPIYQSSPQFVNSSYAEGKGEEARRRTREACERLSRGLSSTET